MPKPRQEETSPVPETAYTRKYFLEGCSGYERFSFQGSQLGGAMQRCFLRADVHPGDRVLDLGCGRGEILYACQRAGAHVFGTDYSTVAVEIVREYIRQNGIGGIAVAQAALPDVGFPDKVFDKVFLLDVVEHIPEPVLLGTLDGVARVMADGGVLVIHTDNKIFRTFTTKARKGFHFVISGHWEPEGEHEKLHINYQSLGGMVRKLKARGFRMVFADYITPASIEEIRPWTGLRSRAAQRLAYVVLKALLATPLRHFLCPTFDIVASRGADVAAKP